MTPIERQTRPALKAAVLVVTLAVVLALLELGLRVVGYHNPRFSERDDQLGTARIPGVEFVYTDEGRGHVRINDAGFRDGNWSVPKPADTLRIAILGDSYVEALQVEEDERFSEIAERLLDRSAVAGGKRVQVMNFGVSGFSTAQELLTLRHRVWSYSPDLVVLAITPANDVRNNYKPLEQDNGRPYFVVDEGGLVLDDSFRHAPEHNRGAWHGLILGLSDHSRLVAFSVRTVRSAVSRAARRQQLARAGGASGAEDEPGLDVWVFAEPSDDAQREAWRVTEKIIETMNSEVRARGAGFLAMVVTSGRQVDPDPASRETFRRRLGVDDLFYAEKRIEALGDRVDFPVLSLAPALQVAAESQQKRLHGFDGARSAGHWNRLGHQEAGRLLAEKIASLWQAGTSTDGTE